jgi:hypothetical protein
MGCTMNALRRSGYILALVTIATITASQHADARGAVPPAKTKPPGGNVGAWLGDGPIFGFDDPFGEGLWEDGWQHGMPEGHGGGREYGGGGMGGGTGGGGVPGPPHDCMKQIMLDDFSTVVVKAACECKLKLGKRPPPIGSWADGVCEPSDWDPSDDCAHKGECCQGEYVPTYGT